MAHKNSSSAFIYKTFFFNNKEGILLLGNANETRKISETQKKKNRWKMAKGKKRSRTCSVPMS